MNKEAIRKDMLVKRAKLALGLTEMDKAHLINQCLELIEEMGGEVVAGYHPVHSEVDVLPLMAKLVEVDFITALPAHVAENQPFCFRRWVPGAETVPGPFRVPEPMPDADVVSPDVILVPMIAYDAKGYRIGYGSGYYDRTLGALLQQGKKPLAIGVAYAGQQMSERLPVEPHDIPLDWVVTEKEAVRCGD